MNSKNNEMLYYLMMLFHQQAKRVASLEKSLGKHFLADVLLSVRLFDFFVGISFIGISVDNFEILLLPEFLCFIGLILDFWKEKFFLYNFPYFFPKILTR